MIFNSISFIVFLPIVFLLYWSLNGRKLVYQNLFLLLASYFFYGWWDWRFLGLIVFSTFIDYVMGYQMSLTHSKKSKKIFLIISLFTNLGLLIVFKYYNFFIESFENILQSIGLQFDTWTLNIILPVGISFYTFQTLSYTIDIYKNKIKPTKDILSFAVFVSFFPQLVAGPIERASHLLPQFLEKRTFKYSDAVNGLNLIAYGFFKKVVIADRLAIYVNNIFNDIGNANTISLILGAVFFSFQIYADFSGYSLIARGISKLLGFDLMVNFNKPYIASNIQDFWRRWHISLSSWFRDYVYIPLGGNRTSVSRNYFNVFTVFVVSGLWHGANWTFIVWGALHGIYQIIYLSGKKILPKVGWNLNILNILFVYSIVTFAWIFFRANNISEAWVYISKLAELDFSFNLVQVSAQKGPLNLFISLLVITLLLISYLLPKNLQFKSDNKGIAFLVIMLLTIFTFGINGESQFIYFQF